MPCGEAFSHERDTVVPRTYETALLQDPTVGPCLGFYGVSGGVNVSYERGTPVPVKPDASLKLAARQPACTAKGGALFIHDTSSRHSCLPPNGHLLPSPRKPRGASGKQEPTLSEPPN